MAGALIVGAVVVVAVIAARSGGDDAQPAAVVVDVDQSARRVAGLEERLQRAPSHPCRTELLDELLDRQSLQALLDPIAADVDACVTVAAGAPALRAWLEHKKLLEPPSSSKKKPATPQQKRARLDELTRRARLALDAGRSDVARGFLEEVVSADPLRVDERRLLAEAYRREGELALAAVELRAFLLARPQSPERPRLLRWLKKNNLPL